MNNAFPNERRPNFIDSEGRICAVGYLIEQSLGREAAEDINEKYQYEYVLEMESKLLEKWAYKNGFTAKELAMIQPAYEGEGCYLGCTYSENNTSKISKPAESVVIGANAGMLLVNGFMAANKSSNMIAATTG